jgi:hypothetical protein
MRLDSRLTRLEQQCRWHARRDQLSFITAIPVGRDAAQGRAPGLYRSDRPGSTVGELIFDPAQGDPVVPENVLAPWGLVVICGPEVVEPPVGGPAW